MEFAGNKSVICHITHRSGQMCKISVLLIDDKKLRKLCPFENYVFCRLNEHI